MKERIVRAKRALPNGYCGLPPVQTCPHPNACLPYESFLTDGSFLDVHRRQLTETKVMVAQAREAARERLVETLEADTTALTRITDGLDELEDGGVVGLRNRLETA